MVSYEHTGAKIKYYFCFKMVDPSFDVCRQLGALWNSAAL